MAGHNDVWRKRILLPLWIIQLIGLIIFLGLAALTLWVWNQVEDNYQDGNPDVHDYLDKAVE